MPPLRENKGRPSHSDHRKRLISVRAWLASVVGCGQANRAGVYISPSLSHLLCLGTISYGKKKIRISILPTPPHHYPLLLQLNGAWCLWTQYFTRVGSKGGPFLLSSSYQQRKPLTSAKSHTASWAQHIQPSELCGVQPVKYEPWILESRNLIKGRRGGKTVCIISGGRLLLHSLMRAYFYLSNSTTTYH